MRAQGRDAHQQVHAAAQAGRQRPNKVAACYVHVAYLQGSQGAWAKPVRGCQHITRWAHLHPHHVCSKRAPCGLHCCRAHVERNVMSAVACFLNEQGDGAYHVAASAANLKAPVSVRSVTSQTHLLSL